MLESISITTLHTITILTITTLFLLCASISDLKTREVPNLLNYGALFLGLLLNILFSLITTEIHFALRSVFGLIVTTLLSYLLFYTGQWGGGDSKALMALGALIGLNVTQAPPLLITLIIGIFVTGALYGLVWSIALGLQNRTTVLKKVKQIHNNPQAKKIKTALVIALLLGIIIQYTSLPKYIKIMTATLIITTTLVGYLWTFIISIEKTCMIKQYTVHKLTPGDWINKEITLNQHVLFEKQHNPLSKHDIEKIKTLLKKFYPKTKLKRTFFYLIKIPLTTTPQHIKKGDVLLENVNIPTLQINKQTKITQTLYEKIQAYKRKHALKLVKVTRTFLLKQHQTIHPHNLKKGDILTESIIMRHYICGPQDLGIHPEQIEELKEQHIKEVPVKVGIPFIPSFFFGLIAALMFHITTFGLLI